MARFPAEHPLGPRQYDLALEGPGRPVVTLTNLILAEGLRSRASTIRIATSAAGCSVHYLIDGEWKQVMTIPNAAGMPTINRLRVMADLDPTARRRPHSGEIHAVLDGNKVVLRAQLNTNPDSSQEMTIDCSATAA